MVKGGRLRKTLPRIKQLAYASKEVAYAIIRQAILREANPSLMVTDTTSCIGFGRKQSSKLRTVQKVQHI